MDTKTHDHVGSTATLGNDARFGGMGAAKAPDYTDCSDETLVLRARAGEFAAFDALIARHEGGLYALALGSLPNVEAAGAALCEMAVAAFWDIGSIEAPRNTAGWLWLHGFRVVFRRLNPSPGKYTILRWPEPAAAANMLG